MYSRDMLAMVTHCTWYSISFSSLVLTNSNFRLYYGLLDELAERTREYLGQM
jgi:hypothetical protein